MDKGKHQSQDQIDFHPGHIVFGIGFINDPPLRGRSFSAGYAAHTPTWPKFSRERDLTLLCDSSKYSRGGYPVQAKESLGGFVIAGNHRPLTLYGVSYGNRQSDR